MRTTPALVLLGAILLMTTGCHAPAAPGPAEINVLIGPRFWTGDPGHPWAEAIVVSEGRIVQLASRAEVPKLIAGGGTVRQLPGVLAVPGLTDAHGHLFSYALSRRRVSLVGAPTVENAAARVEAWARQHPDDRWILGRGWDQNDWPDKAWPDADRLERAVTGRPCALWRIDGHALWVNRTALAEAGITAETKDPPGGVIRRDATGQPTGILVDEATEIVRKVLPEPTPAELRDAVASATTELLAMGLTGVHDMDLTAAEWDAATALAHDGRLPLRVTAYARLHDDVDARLREHGPITEGRLRVVGTKLYADGALGSRGARLLAPYADDPRNSGLWVTEPADLDREVDALVKSGLQPAVHAIGDAADRAVLDAFEKALAAHPAARDLRPRVEHAQVLAPADVPRFARVGAVASMQPTHATSDMPWAEERLGPERLKGAYAWRSVLDSGARLAFGSDFPIESPDPLRGIYAAVTRQDADGRPAGGWFPRERLTVGEALAAFTSGAAWAAHQENELGRLAPGCWCDLTVLDRDLFDGGAASILDTHVTATVIGGQVAWQGNAESRPKR